jgi:hypothetical protein
MRHPFSEYAMSNFRVHGSKLDSVGTPLPEALDAFMLDKDRTFSCWRDMSWIDTVELFKPSPVHIASWAGGSGEITFSLAGYCD